jgi:hypothetical protein
VIEQITEREHFKPYPLKLGFSLHLSHNEAVSIKNQNVNHLKKEKCIGCLTIVGYGAAFFFF